MKISYILKHSRLITSLFLFILFACQSKKSDCSYNHLGGLDAYLSEVHSLELKEIENTILYLTPISNNCENCIKINLDMLQGIENEKLTPILIGFDKSHQYEKQIQKIKHTLSTTLFDKDEKVYSFRTGFSKPILVHIVKGNCSYFLEVNDFVLEEAEEYIKNN